MMTTEKGKTDGWAEGKTQISLSHQEGHSSPQKEIKNESPHVQH